MGCQECLNFTQSLHINRIANADIRHKTLIASHLRYWDSQKKLLSNFWNSPIFIAIAPFGAGVNGFLPRVCAGTNKE
jgi:hypothetical protein